ncbi:hypothetical protein QI30_08850 [Kurthia sp. 3B1D]|uniref:DUF2513 domain-containing protein n=1 Tax=Candidatus Kurthia intestinigallinarum TaxID=1562256 RepID=A0A433RSE7_9BACL|nr:DUF2513 domain-containing protein [Kurthia sp. 3B1D]RUS55068.1 hypothetical protein QI30_08850 [Kurthia sp. 3B1D]
MQRDMEYIRELLFQLEREEYTRTIQYRTEEGAKYKYHLDLLSDAGFVEVKMQRPTNTYIPLIQCPRITWDGHEYLDSIRKDNIWENVKERLSIRDLNLSSASFGIIKELATLELKKYLGI